MRRVVVTGLGAVTPLGNTVPEFWTNVVAGKSGVRAITLFDASAMPTRIAGEVRGFEPGELIGKKEARRMDRFAQSRWCFSLVLKAKHLYVVEQHV